jgi:hypothetical protein
LFLFSTGSPEKRQLVADALSRNYAVFVPDEVHSEWGAWPEDNPDVLSVVASITEWKYLKGLQGIPTVAIGISAGGWILGTVALRPGFFDAICLMVSAPKEEAIAASSSNFPPTIFVHMPRDNRIAPRVTTSRYVHIFFNTASFVQSLLLRGLVFSGFY